jgi:hypothetical protein
MAEQHDRNGPAKGSGRFLGTLREALAAAARDDVTRTAAPSEATLRPQEGNTPTQLPALAAPSDEKTVLVRKEQAAPSAAEAAREARGGTPNIPPVDKHVEFDNPPTTKVVRGSAPPPVPAGDPARTQLMRGKQKIKRGQFHQDPVVGWLVVVGGPGLGAYRPIYEGNNTVGRDASQRIAIDFGDTAISSIEQAYVRYDSAERSFLFVPNLSKTNVVSVNEKRPTSAVALSAMDVITMGHTQLVFVPFCGPEFDWSELPELKD